MKLKTVRKKIRRLEMRLQKGPKKLAKLKRQLEAMTKADAMKAKRKLAARAGKAHQSVKAATPTQHKTEGLAAQPPVKPAGPKKPDAARKVKRKLNLSPGRRAQLAAAMKARWAVKRAAAEATPDKT